MKKSIIKKIVTIFIVFFLCLGSLSATILTFDTQTFLQNLLQRMQDAENFVQQVKKWQEDIAMYEQQIKQIESYFSQIQGISEQILNGSFDLTKIWDLTKKLIQTTDQVIAETDEALEEIKKEEEKIKEDKEKYVNDLVKKTFGDLITTDYDKATQMKSESEYKPVIDDIGNKYIQTVTKIFPLIHTNRQAYEDRIRSGESVASVMADIDEAIESCNEVINKANQDKRESSKSNDGAYQNLVYEQKILGHKVELRNNQQKVLDEDRKALASITSDISKTLHDQKINEKSLNELIAERDNLVVSIDMVANKIDMLDREIDESTKQIEEYKEILNRYDDNNNKADEVIETYNQALSKLKDTKTYINGFYGLSK